MTLSQKWTIYYFHLFNSKQHICQWANIIIDKLENNICTWWESSIRKCNDVEPSLHFFCADAGEKGQWSMNDNGDSDQCQWSNWLHHQLILIERAFEKFNYYTVFDTSTIRQRHNTIRFPMMTLASWNGVSSFSMCKQGCCTNPNHPLVNPFRWINYHYCCFCCYSSKMSMNINVLEICDQLLAAKCTRFSSKTSKRSLIFASLSFFFGSLAIEFIIIFGHWFHYRFVH